jgi:riboflavin synthase
MFTGIIEEIGTVSKIVREAGNIHFTIQAQMTPE